MQLICAIRVWCWWHWRSSMDALTCSMEGSSPPEIREPLADPAIRALIPGDYRIQLVTHCRSSLMLMPDVWVRDDLSPSSAINNHAIEILSPNGVVMAAVGWVARPDRSVATTTGTFVSFILKRRGLGQALWRTMIGILRQSGYGRVVGCAISDEGYTLLARMKTECPGFVEFAGNGHEDLRKSSQRSTRR